MWPRKARWSNFPSVLFFIKLITSSFIKVSLNFSLQPPSTPSAPPESKIELGDLVFTTPDTRPGVDPRLSVACYGKVTDLQFDGKWNVKITSQDDGRNHVSVSENCVHHQSKSINSDCFINTRGAVKQRLIESKKQF